MEEQIELLVQESDAGIRVDAYLRSNTSFSLCYTVFCS